MGGLVYLVLFDPAGGGKAKQVDKRARWGILIAGG